MLCRRQLPGQSIDLPWTEVVGLEVVGQANMRFVAGCLAREVAVPDGHAETVVEEANHTATVYQRSLGSQVKGGPMSPGKGLAVGAQEVQ